MTSGAASASLGPKSRAWWRICLGSMPAWPSSQAWPTSQRSILPGSASRWNCKARTSGPTLNPLVGANRGEGQAGGARRNLELIAVPVQDRRVAEPGEGRGPAGVGQGQWGKADFLDAHRFHVGAEHPCDDLPAQADAEEWPPGLQTPPNQIEFGREKRVGFLVEGPDRRAEDHEEIGGRGVDRRQIVGRRIGIADLIPLICEEGLKDAQVFKMNVTDGDR
jgi:hypothetical protein